MAIYGVDACLCNKANIRVCCYAVVDIPPGVQRSCTGQGPDTWRTFDGLQFVFKGQCRYLVFSDGQRLVGVRPVDCSRYSTCKKVMSAVLSLDHCNVMEILIAC